MSIGTYLYKSRKSGHSTTNPIIRLLIRKKYRDTCQLCKRVYSKRLALYMPQKYFRYIEIDHIIPFSRGGRNHIENYQLTCRACNRRKGAYIENEI